MSREERFGRQRCPNPPLKRPNPSRRDSQKLPEKHPHSGLALFTPADVVYGRVRSDADLLKPRGVSSARYPLGVRSQAVYSARSLSNVAYASGLAAISACQCASSALCAASFIT